MDQIVIDAMEKALRGIAGEPEDSVRSGEEGACVYCGTLLHTHYPDCDWSNARDALDMLARARDEEGYGKWLINRAGRLQHAGARLILPLDESRIDFLKGERP